MAKGDVTGMKGGQGVYGMLRDNISTARTIMMPGRAEWGSLGRKYAGGGRGLTGLWAGGRAYMGVGAAPGTVGMLERHWRAGGLTALEARGGRAFRQVAGGMALGGAMIGTSMLTGWSVFDQAQAMGGAALMGRKLAPWARGGGPGRQAGLGVAMGAAGFGAQYLSTGELMAGATGWGAMRAAQWYAGNKAIAAGGGMGARTLLSGGRFGGGWGRAAGAAAGIGAAVGLGYLL